MSITANAYRRERRRALRSRVLEEGELSNRCLEWMAANNKAYSRETLIRFGLREALVECQQQDEEGYCGGGVCWAQYRAILIPVGPITRVYLYTHPEKSRRWRVMPAGEPAQWIGGTQAGDVIICEGEWDCMRLHDQGFTQAVTHTAGAMTWLPTWTKLFAGRRVWVCLDRDDIGRKGANKVARNLNGIAREVRMVDLPLPGTHDSNDVSDYFNQGGDNNGFQQLLDHARLYVPSVHAGR